MLNQVVLIGRTTKDLEVRTSTNGREYAIATLAVSRPFKSQNTNTYETDFIDVSLWGKTAINVAKYAGKGSFLSIRGRITNRFIDVPHEKTFRTIGIVGDQVSFIQTKAPGLNQTTPNVTKTVIPEIPETPQQEDVITEEKDFPDEEDFTEAMVEAQKELNQQHDD